jgi:hypothetical protein
MSDRYEHLAGYARDILQMFNELEEAKAELASREFKRQDAMTCAAAILKIVLSNSGMRADHLISVRTQLQLLGEALKK